MSERKLYFPNLNGVRAIAAFMVIIFHIELIKCEFGIKNFLGYTHLGCIKRIFNYLSVNGRRKVNKQDFIKKFLHP